MTQAILVALLTLAQTGKCTEADGYPMPLPGEVTGYTVIGTCALPTTKTMTAKKVQAIYRQLKGEITTCSR